MRKMWLEWRIPSAGLSSAMQHQWHITYCVTAHYCDSGLSCYTVVQPFCTLSKQRHAGSAKINTLPRQRWMCLLSHSRDGVVGWVLDVCHKRTWGSCLIHYPKDQSSTDEWSHHTWQPCREIPTQKTHTQRRRWQCTDKHTHTFTNVFTP